MANWFVDFSAANDGDGTAFGQASSSGAVGAYNTLASKTFAAGDFVWMRRKSKTISSQLTLSNTGTFYIGWPQSGDTYYSVRPVAAQASWDADAVGYAEITSTTSLTSMASLTAFDQEFHRVKFNYAYTGTDAANAVTVASKARFFNCWMEHAGTASANAQNILVINALVYIRSTTITFTGANTSGANVGPSSMVSLCILASGGNAFTSQFIDCTITITSVSAEVAFFGSRTSVITRTYFIDCTFDCDSTATFYCLFDLAGTTGNSGHTTMYNCSMDSAATALWFGSNVVSFFTAMRLSINSGYLLGATSTHGGLNFSKFTPSVTPAASSTNISVTGGLITGSNLSFLSNTGTICLAGNVNSYFRFQNCTFAGTTASVETGGIWVNDYGATVGDFRFTGHRGTIQSSTVTRDSSSSTLSLKYDMSSGTVGTNPFWKQLAKDQPTFETTYVTLPASLSTITIYGTHKGYGGDPPTLEDLWFDLDYLDDAASQHVATASCRTYATGLTSDASTWTGDSSLTSFKLVVAITPGQACLCPIRIYFKKRVASAYLYIDPKPIVT